MTEDLHTDNTRIVAVLYRAQSVLHEFTPPGVRVDLQKHSTATHCHIYLELRNEKPLLVWYKTNWTSGVYEFNEEGKTIGLQPGCEFIEADLHTFFGRVEKHLALLEEAARAAKEDQAAAQDKAESEHLERVKRRYLKLKGRAGQ